MNIRKAVPEDASGIAKVHVDSWRSAYRGLLHDGRLDRLDYIRGADHFRETIIRESEGFYVVEDVAGIIGVLVLGPCRDQELDCTSAGEVYALYLAPDYWRKGIGRVVMREAELLLKSQGYSRIALWVFESNKPARLFYETIGFTADGVNRIIDAIV
ncbi:MAG: GNAT family N-acetyltransferase [Deltaproteobacteria bacterium]|nr:GNAT family N-acetyltransferase [Deltaproteobacteria bacterium]